MLETIKCGARTCEPMHRFNCPESTIRSLKKNKEALTDSVNVFSRFSSNRTFSDNSQRNLLLVITKHYLHKWVERRHREQGGLCGPQIRHQACVYYAAVVQKKHVNSPPSFNASVVWLAAFKKRCEVKFAHYHGESASADVITAEKYLPVFKALVKEGAYCRDQIFNCEETGIFWKRSPRTTFIAKDEKQARGIKTSKDRITVIFTANASGDFLMKPPIVNRAARPRAYHHAAAPCLLEV
ncbi:tigger transposable element-derived protein 1-like [Homarus americanus]|uniref:tigger transposable element-derived protein 1-like n=1 Tax=Homarus americanus TaxID=6706 RepID=UPI001C465D88|nr:tigger transposable element-derived protein 1-like [Homarus americanus]